MLNNISWQGYWLSLALFTAGYYFFLYLRFFRNDVNSFLQRRNPPTASPSTTPAVTAFLKQQSRSSPFSTDVASDFETPEDDAFSVPAGATEQAVYACMDELNAYFGAARKARMMKAEIVYAVQRILQKYPSLQTSEYKEAIGNVVRTEAEHHCSVHLSDEEVSKVWMMT